MTDTTFVNDVTQSDGAGWAQDINDFYYKAHPSGVPDNSICDGRLTLTTGVPVTTSDVTAAGTLYFTPYKGSRIALYDGSARWQILTFTELSLALTLTSGKPYDVFCYNNSGIAALESLVWTNDTTRATALTTQNGVLVKTGATTRRYVGTIYSSGANTTEDSLAKRYVWNYYNRVLRQMRAVDTTDSWNYTTATLRQANANTANQLDFIIGVSEDSVWATAQSQAVNSGASSITGNIGVGLDSTTVNSAQLLGPGVIASTTRNTQYATYEAAVTAGRHKLVWLEQSAASGTTTWYGDDGTASVQSGIYGRLPA